MTTHSITQPHALYRFYSDSGQLLYVGITNNPGNRFSQHQTDKPWWHEVAGISVEKHDTREDALAAETRAISVESPRHNKRRPTLSKQRTAGPHRPRERQLVWLCSACAEPVADNEGYIHVSMAQVNQAEADSLVFDERTTYASGWQILTGNDLMNIPAHAPWLIHHQKCDPDIESVDYCIEVERARTHAKLLNWTAHLMEKNWLVATNWDRFIFAASGVEA